MENVLEYIEGGAAGSHASAQSPIPEPMQTLSRENMTRQVETLLAARHAHPPLAYVHSYGCQQNVSDGEHLQGVLARLGYGFTDDAAQADLIVLNTCAVRENAENRVYGNVGAMSHLKKKNPALIIAVCGCMTQQPQARKKLRESFPHVDIVFGANAVHKLPEHLYRVLSTRARVIDDAPPEHEIVENLPVRREGGVKAWLPIMQGCDNFCTYCIVPYVRGRERSRGMEEVLAQARALVREGYKEITLLGQNVNSYGKGLEERADFPTLLRRLNEIDGEFRVRFMTSHPKDCTHALIDAVADCEKVCSHIHLPVQCGSDRVLKEMNRRYTVEQYEELISYARRRIPGVSFTSDIIVGFPGETEEDFQGTLRLIEKVRFTSLFTFIYSPRSGTKAAEMPDPATRGEKAARFRRLLSVQERIGRQIHESQVGETLRILVEGEGKEPGTVTGRTPSGMITEFPGDNSLVGRFVNVRVTKALNWAILGERDLDAALV